MNLGNILSYNGQAKLADLEYAKRRGDLTSHEMRTASGCPITLSGKSLIASQQGTVHFMSIEVAAQAFLFFPPPTTSLRTSRRSRRAVGQGQGLAVASFYHNHLHDLESLWWVTVWIAFYNNFLEGESSHDQPSPSLQDTKKQLKLAGTLFLRSLENTTRQNIFQGYTDFPVTCDNLSSNKNDLCDDLDYLRVLLLEHYRAVEAGYPASVDPDSSEYSIYEEFSQVFKDLKASYKGWKLDRIVRICEELLKAEKSKKSKGPRSDSTADAGTSGS